MLSQREVEFLLDEVCTKLGFCLSPQDRERLQLAPPPSPEEFATAVLLGEGLDPRSERRHYAEVLAIAQRAFGRVRAHDA